jgi:hypothetical protein
MKSALWGVILPAALATTGAGAFAQGAAVSVGHLQSLASHTFANALHPGLTGGDTYLKSDVAADGSFSGESTTRRPAVVAAATAAAVGALAQEPQVPTGLWQSPAHATYTNAAHTGSGLYLSIDVAGDGRFRGNWSPYLCQAYPGVYGLSTYSCSPVGGHRVTGRFGPGRQGVIELDTLGRSAFTWAAPSADELAIELPEDWQGKDPVLYRARMTRDGKPRLPGAAATPPPGQRGESPPSSAVALYREFKKDEKAALTRHGGKTLVLDARRGNLIALSNGGAAVHVADGFQSRALVLYFREMKEVGGIEEGALFHFRCTVRDFDYQYIQMENCSVVR